MVTQLSEPEILATLAYPEVVKCPDVPASALDAIRPELLIVCDHYDKTNRPKDEAEFITNTIRWAGETNTPLLVPTFPWFIRSKEIGWAQLGQLFRSRETFDAIWTTVDGYTNPSVRRYGEVDMSGLVE